MLVSIFGILHFLFGLTLRNHVLPTQMGLYIAADASSGGKLL
jgi:hypothetical protein